MPRPVELLRGGMEFGDLKLSDTMVAVTGYSYLLQISYGFGEKRRGGLAMIVRSI